MSLGCLQRQSLHHVCMSVQETSYWAAMMSCVTHSLIKCDDGSQCGRPKDGRFAPANSPSIYVPYCVLDPLHGASQRVSTIIVNHAASRVDCNKCAAQLTKREHFVRAPMVLSLFTCAQQVSACHNSILQFPIASGSSLHFALPSASIWVHVSV